MDDQDKKITGTKKILKNFWSEKQSTYNTDIKKILKGYHEKLDDKFGKSG